MMNDNNKNMDSGLKPDRIDLLVERYFNAETTIEEEEELKLLVANDSNPRYDDIRAVLGYVTVKRGQRKKAFGRNAFGTAMRVAAMVAVVIAVGFGIMRMTSQEENGIDNHCYAYVQGQRISDVETVTAIMGDNLSDLRTAAGETDEDIQGQFEDVRNALQDLR